MDDEYDEYAEKFIAIPITKDFKDEQIEIIKRALILFQKGLINSNLNIKIDNVFKESTNAFDYLLEEDKFNQLLEGKIENNSKVFTNISPFQIFKNKKNNKKQTNKINWIKNG